MLAHAGEPCVLWHSDHIGAQCEDPQSVYTQKIEQKYPVLLMERTPLQVVCEEKEI